MKREMFGTEEIDRIRDVAAFLGTRVTHAEFEVRSGVPVPTRFIVSAGIHDKYIYCEYDCPCGVDNCQRLNSFTGGVDSENVPSRP